MRTLYAILRLLNTITALSRGKYFRTVGRRAGYRATRRIFK